MRLIQIFKTKKLFLLNIFLTLYVGINLISGERGLFSYFKKKHELTNLKNEEDELLQEIMKNNNEEENMIKKLISEINNIQKKDMI